jgi:hypothetical protein
MWERELEVFWTSRACSKQTFKGDSYFYFLIHINTDGNLCVGKVGRVSQIDWGESRLQNILSSIPVQLGRTTAQN